MKQEKLEKIRAKTSAELQQELEQKKKDLIEAKFKLGKQNLENVHLPNKIRKEIAVIKTVMTEKRSLDKKDSQSETKRKETKNE